MKHNIIAILLPFFIYGLSMNARADDKIAIKGSVYDRATDTPLFTAEARLLNAQDSSLVARTPAIREYDGPVEGTFVKKPDFDFRHVDRNRKYILQLTSEKYEPLYLDLDPAAVSGRASDMDLGKIYMKRQARTLDEVMVKASKVMFYHKGDTVIYNADAFVLAEGSMLDALIRQMPGVELRDGGEIYVDGRYVENLLLNGKDFFKGNRQMMLENLGAYTVKNIAVYERQDEMDRIMGKDYGERHLSMDVRLKKEYHQGLLGNAEAGYGSSGRYLGRLFGLWYADNARLSIYGNVNNLSDSRKPGQDTGFTPGSMKSGDFKTYQGGFDYWAKIPYRDISFSGDIMATHRTVDDDRSVLTTNFLPAGDTFGYSYSRAKNKSLALSTAHSLDLQNEKWNLKVNPSFRYSRNDDLSSASAATFSEEWKDVGKDFIDNLYQEAPADVLASILNRSVDENKRIGHSIDAGLSANGKAKMPNGADAITYLATANYRRRHFDRFQRYMLNFGSDSRPADSFDRYFGDFPDYTWEGSGALGYVWAIRAGLYLDAWYQYDHSSGREVSDLYRLDNLLDRASAGRLIGWLPSKSEYEATLDPDNSFNSRRIENRHSINFNLTWV